MYRVGQYLLERNHRGEILAVLQAQDSESTAGSQSAKVICCFPGSYPSNGWNTSIMRGSYWTYEEITE